MKLGVVMDPIGSINTKKDTTFAMLREAQARDWTVFCFEQRDLFLRDGAAWGRARRLRLVPEAQPWFELGAEETLTLGDLDLILMRKDPPFDMEYIHTTYILERAEAAGAWVVNRPAALRDANEKLFTAWFPQCTPPSLVTREIGRVREFLAEQGEIVVKPLGGMGGESIFRLCLGDTNTNVVLETVTGRESRFVMAQRYLPEISQGDKRIILIDGEPACPYALARIPPAGDFRGNLAVGGQGTGVALSERDRWICAEVGPLLREKGLLFVGLDVIGDSLTEINVTSPTGVRELDALYGLNLAGQLLETLARHLRR